MAAACIAAWHFGTETGRHVIAADGGSDHASPASDGMAGWILLPIAAVLSAAVLFIGTRRGWLRLPPLDPSSPQRADVATWLVGLFLFQILIQVVPVWLLHGTVSGETIAGRATLQWLGYAIQVPSAILIVRAVGPVARTPLTAALVGAAGLLCALPIITLGAQCASMLQQMLTEHAPSKVGHETLRMLLERGSDPWAWAVIAAVTIGAPILEEIAYRGGLQGAIRALGIGPWPAILLTSAFFAIMHLGAIPQESVASAMTGLAVLSIALGLLRERTGGLVAPIVAHSLFNVLNLLLAWTLAGSA